ncbi:hypothetical protein [Cupriavidus metallidurans]|uniref:hypothetical protein n=1 Tax=Cupriavidus metallidurans TaxID=119219 RepID=UPI001CCAF092|nr:hypothetical protein [Cupriavidus metallidurans]UBM07694.1 hypothetical protein LAI70_08195 [Cupriavidus metallidurans]
MGCPVNCSTVAAVRCLVKMNASVIEPGLQGANIQRRYALARIERYPQMTVPEMRFQPQLSAKQGPVQNRIIAISLPIGFHYPAGRIVITSHAPDGIVRVLPLPLGNRN